MILYIIYAFFIILQSFFNINYIIIFYDGFIIYNYKTENYSRFNNNIFEMYLLFLMALFYKY